MTPFKVGQMVTILEPFGDGSAINEVVEVQYVNANGEFCEEVDANHYQYILDDTLAYDEKFLKALD